MGRRRLYSKVRSKIEDYMCISFPKSKRVYICSLKAITGPRKSVCRNLKMPSLNRVLGFGVVKLIFGGIICFSRARAVLITLITSAAPSKWPELGLTDPFYTPLSPKTLIIA